MMKQQLFTLATFLLLSMVSCSSPSPFIEKVETVMQTSLAFRNDTTGIWETAGWWNSANVLTAVIRYGELSGDKAVLPVIDDVFTKARHYQTGVDSTGTPTYCTGFINDYYDDEGWWALAWIEAYNLTKEKKYLNMAVSIFDDMSGGWSDACGGGVFWKKPQQYKNSIANNLFALTAARLYKATGESRFLDWFRNDLAWYLQTGMINTEIYQVEDGTTSDCRPNRGAHYTYNQGVAIAVLAEMYLHTNDNHYLELAEMIARKTINQTLVTEEGILKETNPATEESADGIQFKGIFIRHLAFLYKVTQNPVYKDFIIKNATSIVTNNYDPDSRSFGSYWFGPFNKVHAGGNSSALECVLEGWQLTK